MALIPVVVGAIDGVMRVPPPNAVCGHRGELFERHCISRNGWMWY